MCNLKPEGSVATNAQNMEVYLEISECLQMLTVILAGIFVGATGYVTLCEAPSRERLPLLSHWEQWCESFRRASKIMVCLHVLSDIYDKITICSYV